MPNKMSSPCAGIESLIDTLVAERAQPLVRVMQYCTLAPGISLGLVVPLIGFETGCADLVTVIAAVLIVT